MMFQRSVVHPAAWLGALLTGVLGLGAVGMAGCGILFGNRDDVDVVDLTLIDDVIGPAGGFIELPGVARLTIPPDVLESNRSFTLSIENLPGAPIATGVAASAVIVVTTDAPRLISPATLEINYQPGALPDTVDADAIALLTEQDGTWVPAPHTDVDLERRVVRSYPKQLGTWVVAAPPRNASTYTVEAEISPTILSGNVGSDVVDDLAITATVTAPAGRELLAGDVRVFAELYGTDRDSADAFARVSWAAAAPTAAALIPDTDRRRALATLAAAWDADVAPRKLNFEYLDRPDRARIELVLDRSILAELRNGPAAVYRLDLWVVAGDWPESGRSAVTRTYLFSPRYLPLVAAAESQNLLPEAVSQLLVWQYPDADYEPVEGFRVFANPRGFTLLISTTGDPYTRPGWRLSSNGARRPTALADNLGHDNFFQVSVDPAARTATWSCLLPASITAQLEPGEYSWAVITDSRVAWEADTAADPLLWPQIPDGRTLPWPLLDPTPVSDSDGNGVHDFQSPVFRFTVGDPPIDPPGDDCAEPPCDVDTDGVPTCTINTDCAADQVCVGGSCVPRGTVDPGPPEMITLAIGGGESMDLRRIVAGSFAMGNAAGYPDEQPVHPVTLSTAFYIGQTEVTQDQWFAVMGTNPSIFMGDGRRPVEFVSWDDAVQFCDTLSASTGRTVRLPTEAEWEYACRADTTTVYAFGDDAADFDDHGWYLGNSGSITQPVGGKTANAWDLYDMHGNVWEWCADWYGDTYYATSPGTDPAGPNEGDARVLRGGSWERQNDIGSATRGRSDPSVRHNGLGLRVVVEE